MTQTPFPQSFWIQDGLLCAGCYPGAPDSATRDAKLQGLLDCGIRRVLSLMEVTEKDHGGRAFEPYAPRLRKLAAARKMAVECLSLPIRDASAPTPEVMRQILDQIEIWLQAGLPMYIHCWGGHGRTGTVIACHLIRQGNSPRQAIETLLRWRAPLPKNHYPFEGDQEAFVLSWGRETRREKQAADGASETVHDSRELLSRHRGCLLGLACGDAVGTTVEFSSRGSFPPITDMVGGGPFRLPVGAWTDDTSMALCLASSLAEMGRFDPADQMRRYCQWHENGYLSSTGRCFDIGVTIRESLARFRQSGNPFSGSSNPQSAGNGCIMRLAPVPMFFHPDSTEAAHWAGESSRTTHGTLECIESCQLLAAMICSALSGRSKEEILFDHETSRFWSPKVRAIAAGEYRDKNAEDISGSGYVIDCLEASAWCFWRSKSFREAILLAVNLGDDADTTGAVCGQIAGAFHGEHGIPSEWLSRLVMANEIRSLADRLANPKTIKPRQ